MNIQVKVVFWFTFVGFLQRGISLLTTPIFTRVLSTEEYGIFNVFTAWMSTFAIIVTLNLHSGVINNAFTKTKYSHEKIVSTFQSLSLITSLVFFVLSLIFQKQLAILLNIPEILVFFLFLGFLFMEPYQNWLIYKRYQYDYKVSLVFTCIISLLTPIVSLISLLFFRDYRGEVRVISYVIVNTIIPGLIFYVINYKKDRTFYCKDLWNYAISFNLPLIPHYLSETILNQTDKIMINAYFGTSQTAIYSVANSAASIIQLFTSALNIAFVPWQYQKLKDQNYDTLAKAAYFVLIALATILLVMILFAPEVIMVLADSSYNDAIFLIPTLAASVFFNYMYQIFSRFEMYYERKIYTVIATFVAMVVNIGLNMLLMPIMGYIAAGYSTLIAHIIFCIMHFIFYKKVCHEFIPNKTVYNGKVIFIISFIVLLLSFILVLIYDYLFIRIGVLITLFIMAFLYRNHLIRLFKKYFMSGGRV